MAVDLLLLNSLLLPISEKLVADNMKCTNVLVVVTAISCTSNKSQGSCTVLYLKDDQDPEEAKVLLLLTKEEVEEKDQEVVLHEIKNHEEVEAEVVLLKKERIDTETKDARVIAKRVMKNAEEEIHQKESVAEREVMKNLSQLKIDNLTLM